MAYDAKKWSLQKATSSTIGFKTMSTALDVTASERSEAPAAEGAADRTDEGLVGHRSASNKSPPRTPLFRR